MIIDPIRIFSLGDNAVTVEFGNEVSEKLNRAAIDLAVYFNKHPFPGFIEAVPAMASTTIFYQACDVRSVETSLPTAFAAVEARVLDAVTKVAESDKSKPGTIEVPVSFAREDSLDLSGIAEWAGITPHDVIDIFLARYYRVYMLGFLPGFAYMGDVDDRIAVPRLSTPRTAVPKGSVGIAGRQTGIYPSESPGGWQIIGRTNLELLTNDADQPCVFRPGDNVRFVRAG